MIDVCKARICHVLTAWAQSSLSIDGIENSAADISKSTFTSWQNKGHADISMLQMPPRHDQWVSLAVQHQSNHNLQAIKKSCMFGVMLTWRADAAPWRLVSLACCTLANFRPIRLTTASSGTEHPSLGMLGDSIWQSVQSDLQQKQWQNDLLCQHTTECVMSSLGCSEPHAHHETLSCPSACALVSNEQYYKTCHLCPSSCCNFEMFATLRSGKS